MGNNLTRLHESGLLNREACEDQLYDQKFGEGRLNTIIRARTGGKKNGIDVDFLLGQIENKNENIELPPSTSKDPQLERALAYYVAKFGAVRLPGETRPYVKYVADSLLPCNHHMIVGQLMKLEERPRNQLAALLCKKVLAASE
ncbi:MAG: hypothetical protein PHZ00_02830 [Candidatus Peribacteraceae bacterium]|nr:hypothetical protein [Candidatus Peribacteraceae bacterium]